MGPRGNARRDRFLWFCLVFCVALAVRALVVWQLSGSLLFDTILGDAINYDAWARRIAAGDWLGDDVFHQAPGYPYFLAAVYSLVGDDLLAVRSVQIVFGAASCAFLTQAGCRFFSKPVGIAAGLLLALYAPAIFADVSLGKSVFDIFFVSLCLWLVSGLDASPPARRLLGLGLAIGALVLTRENALVFGAVLVPWLLLRSGSAPRRRVAHAALVVAGSALVLLPVALRNAYVGGELHLTTSSFGLNFFIGNNEAADGTYAPVVPRRGDPRVEFQDAIDLAESATGRELSRAEVSAYYFRRAVEYIRSQPGDWLELTARKALLISNVVEVVDTRDQYSHEDASSVLGMAGSLFHLGVLAPLAFLGVWVTWPERRRLLPLHLLFLAYTATLLLFYVFARYRIPLVPILALFAAAGLLQLREFLQTKSRPQVAAGCIATLAVAVFCNWPVFDKDYMRSVTQYNLGNELVATGDVDAALERYQLAIRLHGDNTMANNNLGVLAARRGDLASARRYYEEALRISPGYLDARFNLARTLHELGDDAGAIASYREGLRVGGGRADIYSELGLVHLERGDPDLAIESFERALRIDPGLEEASDNLARALARRRSAGEAGAP